MEYLWWWCVACWTLYGIHSVRLSVEFMEKGYLNLKWVREQFLAWALSPAWMVVCVLIFALWVGDALLRWLLELLGF